MRIPETPFSLDLTDDEFVRLHAAASAEGLEVNDFIVATLRKHAKIVEEIKSKDSEAEAAKRAEI